MEIGRKANKPKRKKNSSRNSGSQVGNKNNNSSKNNNSNTIANNSNAAGNNDNSSKAGTNNNSNTENGDPQREGFISEQKGNFAKAIECYTISAEKYNNPTAQTQLGRMYEEGKGTSVDMQQAHKWYLRAAQQGITLAQVQVGMCLLSGIEMEKDEKEAVRWFETAAKQSYALAQLCLGYCYLDGVGVEKNEKAAVSWWALAATKGNLGTAQHALGCCYWDGVGVPQNQREALKWLKVAANAGDERAQWDLYACTKFLELCSPFPTDNRAGEKWLKKAAEAGHLKAQYKYGKLLGKQQKALGQTSPEVGHTSIQWCVQAAERGHARAQVHLGYCYIKGDLVIKDAKAAVKWYTLAAKQGVLTAQYCLALCYCCGVGVERNEEQARLWCVSAARQSFRPALALLAEFYAQGVCAPKDPEVALHFFVQGCVLLANPGRYQLAFRFRPQRENPEESEEARKLRPFVEAARDSILQARNIFTPETRFIAGVSTKKSVQAGGLDTLGTNWDSLAAGLGRSVLLVVALFLQAGVTTPEEVDALIEKGERRQKLRQEKPKKKKNKKKPEGEQQEQNIETQPQQQEQKEKQHEQQEQQQHEQLQEQQLHEQQQKEQNEQKEHQQRQREEEQNGEEEQQQQHQQQQQQQQQQEQQQQQQQQAPLQRDNDDTTTIERHSTPFSLGVTPTTEATTATSTTSGATESHLTASTVTIGKITFNKGHEIGCGSFGSKVFRGYYDGRLAAIKRLDKSFYGLLDAEIEMFVKLSDSEYHPNIVRFYGRERDIENHYLAMEMCSRTLSSVVSDASANTATQSLLLSPQKIPTEISVKILRGIVEGVRYLHAQNVVHNDLKPDNIFLKGEDVATWTVKIGDLGLARNVSNNQSSFSLTHKPSGVWYAPEVLSGGKKTKKVDIFTLGCLLHYMLTAGGSPFPGDHAIAQLNKLMKGKYNLCSVAHMPEATNLIEAMIQQNDAQRPSIDGVRDHPFFWNHEKRVRFNHTANSRQEKDEKFRFAVNSIKLSEHWVALVHPALFAHASKKTNYDTQSVSDLVRFIRNTEEHLHQQPPSNLKFIYLDILPHLSATTAMSVTAEPPTLTQWIDRVHQHDDHVISEAISLYMFRNRWPSLLMELYKISQMHTK